MPANTPYEYEAKFEVTTGQLEPLRSPATFLDGYETQSVGLLSQTDTYMDTPAYELLRHGLALRVRRNGSVYEAGIKGIQATRKGAILGRIDISIPLPADAMPFDTSTWPNSVEERLDEYGIKLAEIRPILVAEQQRHKTHVISPDSHRRLAEWSLDEVWISPFTGGGLKMDSESDAPMEHDKNHVVAHFHELEIEYLAPEANELAADDERVFAALVDQVQQRFSLKPLYKSKLVRGLENALAQTHDNHLSIAAEMELAEAGRLLLHQQLFQIYVNEHGVRYSKNVKFVHDMRVAVRHARAAIQLSRQAIPAKTLAPIEKGLRRLGRVLGTVRDLDVAIANLRTFGRSLPVAQREALKRVRAILRSRRNQAHAALVELLDSKKHRKFIIGFVDFCVSPADDIYLRDGSSHELHPSQVRHTIPSVILHAFEAVRCYEVAFNDDKLPPLDTFHALRIQAKYLRYLLEFSEHLLGHDGATLITQLQGLQEYLGELNDARVEQERFREWAAHMTKDEALREAIEARLSQSATRIDELSAATPARLRKFVGVSTRRKLAVTLASI